MPCPFPGMDPYIERPAIWGDFQWSMSASISAVLQPLLRPNFASMLQRLYLDSETFQLEVRIVEPNMNCRLATIIEIATPEIKQDGALRSVYRDRCEQYLASDVMLVQIDLLRSGHRLLHVRDADPKSYRYCVSVTSRANRHDLYAWPLSAELPHISLALARGKQVPLDLQAAFTRSWDVGPYPELLRYDGPPPGELSEVEQRWCRERLVSAGFVKSP